MAFDGFIFEALLFEALLAALAGVEIAWDFKAFLSACAAFEAALSTALFGFCGLGALLGDFFLAEFVTGDFEEFALALDGVTIFEAADTAAAGDFCDFNDDGTPSLLEVAALLASLAGEKAATEIDSRSSKSTLNSDSVLFLLGGLKLNLT